VIPRSRAGTLWRALAAAIVVVAATAATTAVAGLLQFKQLATDLAVSAPIAHADVTPLPPPGAPQTLLIIGSDHRAGTSYNSANTDTMMLVRLNAASQTINVLSIPRDLEVQIPGYGTAKINAAYSLGGPNLMIRTIQDNVFPKLRVNHILDVNFRGFSDLVDAIGCVYSMVDHRYYNNTALTDYSSIDIQPGYQKLCGDNESASGALAFVRFRHTDTDIVRNARQQDFIRWAKDQYPTSSLIANRDRLLRIFGENVQTDAGLHSIDGLIGLFDLVLNMDGHTIKTIPFPAILHPLVPGQPDYVTAMPSAEQAAYRAFMTPTPAAKAAPAIALAAGAGRHRGPAALHVGGLVADPADGIGQAARLARVPMPVYYPRLIVAGSQYCSSVTGNCDDPQEPASEYATSYPREYTIHSRHGQPYAAYCMTLVINGALGEYYDVQGTTWPNPPLLDQPTEVKTVDGRRLELFAAGGRLMTVAWRTPSGVYWIENTLAGNIPNRQMVAIAASLTLARR